MKIRFAPQAVADLADIADYISERNLATAFNVEQAIRAAIGLLIDFPELGRDRPDLEVRALGVPRHPYTIYYRIEGDEIWIVHIRDDRRRPLEFQEQ